MSLKLLAFSIIFAFRVFLGPQNISDQQVLGFGSGESQWYFDMYWLRCDRFDSKLSRYCTGSTNVQLFLYATGYQRLDRLELLRGITNCWIHMWILMISKNSRQMSMQKQGPWFQGRSMQIRQDIEEGGSPFRNELRVVVCFEGMAPGFLSNENR